MMHSVSRSGSCQSDHILSPAGSGQLMNQLDPYMYLHVPTGTSVYQCVQTRCTATQHQRLRM